MVELCCEHDEHDGREDELGKRTLSSCVLYWRASAFRNGRDRWCWNPPSLSAKTRYTFWPPSRVPTANPADDTRTSFPLEDFFFWLCAAMGSPLPIFLASPVNYLHTHTHTHTHVCTQILTQDQNTHACTQMERVRVLSGVDCCFPSRNCAPCMHVCGCWRLDIFTWYVVF